MNRNMNPKASITVCRKPSNPFLNCARGVAPPLLAPSPSNPVYTSVAGRPVLLPEGSKGPENCRFAVETSRGYGELGKKIA